MWKRKIKALSSHIGVVRCLRQEFSLLNVDDLTEKKDTRVNEVLISYPSGHVEVRSPQEKKTIAIIRNMALKRWKPVLNAIFDRTELKEDLPAALKRNVSAEFRVESHN